MEEWLCMVFIGGLLSWCVAQWVGGLTDVLINSKNAFTSKLKKES